MSYNAPTRAEFDELKAEVARLTKLSYGILPAICAPRCGNCESRDGLRYRQTDKPHDEPECPGPHCWICTGEACNQCYPGCDPPCEHDVIERHATSQALLAEPPAPAKMATYDLFQRLWTKAAGTADYDKSEWMEMEARIYYFGAGKPR